MNLSGLDAFVICFIVVVIAAVVLGSVQAKGKG